MGMAAGAGKGEGFHFLGNSRETMGGGGGDACSDLLIAASLFEVTGLWLDPRWDWML